MATRCARLVAVANAICLTLLSATSYAQQGAQQEVAPSVPVAVFVFSNITGEPADDWMGTGIAETVATGLDGVGELVVIRTDPSEIGPGPSSRVRSPIEIAQALEARWAVGGTYQRLADRMRITFHVTDVKTTFVVQSAIIDGAVDELFSLQDRLVTQIRGTGARQSEWCAFQPSPSRRFQSRVGPSWPQAGRQPSLSMDQRLQQWLQKASGRRSRKLTRKVGARCRRSG